MVDLDLIKKESDFALQAGSYIPPVRAHLALLQNDSKATKRWSVAQLKRIFDFCGPKLTSVELASARAMVETIQQPADFAREMNGLRDQLKAIIPKASTAKVGVANVLLVGSTTSDGQQIGTVHPLHVKSIMWGGGIRLTQAQLPRDSDHLQSQDSAQYGFTQGTEAGITFVRNKLDTLDATIYLNNHSIEGSLLDLRCPVEGTSLALAAGVATVSRLLKLSVSADAAFTGFVDQDGSIRAVGGIEAKLRAAIEKGIKRVFIPAGNKLDQPYPGLEIGRVKTLQDVITAVFSTKSLERGIQRLRRSRVPPEMKRRVWKLAGAAGQGGRKVLLTCIGGRDPFGVVARTRKPELYREEGAVLTLAREIQPDEVCLFYTTDRGFDGSNDFRAQARSLQRMLTKGHPGRKITPIPLKTIKDPTDLEQLFAVFQKEILKIIRRHRFRVRYFVNISSGSPQMLLTWYMAVERSLIPKGIRLQVRESRFLQKNESRVRQVEPPGW